MSLIIIQISEPSLRFLKNASSNKKAPPAIVEGFQMSLFALNYTLEKVSMVGENCYIWNFSGIQQVYTYVIKFRKALKLHKKVLKLELDWDEL